MSDRIPADLALRVVGMSDPEICPTCQAIIATWTLDCPCGEQKATTCAPCNLTPAQNGWAHVDHVQLDLFDAAGVTA